MESYNSFAEYYDELMEDARYPERCRYILQTAERLGHNMGRTLDLACGTGSLTLELKKSGVDVFGADGSIEMLSEAMQKSLREDFSERAYTDAELRSMLEKAGFEVVSVCGDLSFEPPREDEQRVIYAAIKKE